MKKATEITNQRKEELGYKPLGKDEVRVYQLLKIKEIDVVSEDAGGNEIRYKDFQCPQNQQVVSEYNFEDYTNNKVGTKEKDIEQIQYRIREKFNDKGEKVPVLGTILFTKSGGGSIRLHGYSPSDRELDAFLYFHHKNQSNQGKPGYKTPKFGYTFKMLDNSKKAEDTFQFEMLIADAVAAIKTWSDPFVKEAAMFLTETSEIHPPRGADTNELRLEFVKLAKKNPKRITTLDKDSAMHVVAVLKEAETKGIIYNNNEHWKWSDTNSDICAIPRGVKPVSALKTFIIDNKNEATFGRIEELLKEKE